MRDPKDKLRATADALVPLKWIRLDDARLQVALGLMDLCCGPEEDADDTIVHEAMRRAGVVLLEALASEVLPARGVEHFSIAAPVLHNPLPVVWWLRVVEFGDGSVPDEFIGGSGELTVHHLLWETSQLIRALPLTPERRLAVITDIEVDTIRLNEIAPLQLFAEDADAKKGVSPLRLERLRKAGKKPDETRIRAVQAIAKDVVAGGFGTLAAFYEKVIEQYCLQDTNGLDRKQVGRWIFGDK